MDTSKLTRDYLAEPLKKKGRNHEIIPECDLIELYLNQNCSATEISNYFDVECQVIKRQLKLYNIRKPEQFHYTKEILEEEYIKQNKSRDEIAKKYGTSSDNVTIWCRKFGIRLKTQEERMENYKKNMNEKYGVDNIFQLEEVKQQILETMKERYGGVRYQQTEEYKQKVKKTKKERYGNANYNNMDKARKTNMKKYGVPQPCMKKNKDELYQMLNSESPDELIKYIKEKGYINIGDFAKQEGMKINTVGDAIRKFNLHYLFDYNKSALELDIVKYIQQFYPNVKTHCKMSDGKELDLVIPELNLAIEINGDHWHSDKFKDKFYHYKKSKLAEEMGLFLYHIFEWEWNFKKELIQNQLKNLLKVNQNKIYARKCEIRYVDKNDSKEFLSKNHIQGNDKHSIAYGLYYNDELVSLMTFAKPRFNKKYQWELSRLCSKADFNIVGGASKLFMHFLKENNPDNIISYSEIAKTKGLIYSSLGFTLEHISEPNYVWTYYKHTLTRYQCQKKHLLEKGYSGKSEKEIMQNLGYMRLYDCGNKVWVWKRPKEKLN